MENQNKYSRLILISLFLGLAFFAIGILVGTRVHVFAAPDVKNTDSSAVTTADFSPFWKVWNLIDEKYPSASSVDAQTRIWGATKGLVSSLGDPYSVFFDPSETKNFQSTINGEISGIGIEIGVKDGGLTVIAPLKDSPAEKAGLRAGDKILKIDGKDASDFAVDEAVDAIRGKAETTVMLSVLSADTEAARDVPIMRADITIPTLDTKELGNGVFMISLYNFGQNADTEFKTAMDAFTRSADTKLILDLREDPGGYLDAAVSIGSWFIPAGQTIVTERSNDASKEIIYKSHGYSLRKTSFKMVVLVDEGSASASEILAGALQEYGIAPLVGKTTYGKGSVQEVVPVTDDTALKITIAKWYTPKGVSISEHGLTPDYTVDRTVDDFKAGRDPQLDKALKVIAK